MPTPIETTFYATEYSFLTRKEYCPTCLTKKANKISKKTAAAMPNREKQQKKFLAQDLYLKFPFKVMV